MGERQLPGSGRRCVADGCERAARVGSATCTAHGKTAEGKALARAVREAADDALRAAGDGKAGRRGDGQDEDEERRRAAERFRRRVRRGSYAGLFEGAVRRIFAEAATGQGLEEELGAIRYALARLVAEEPEAWRLARETARLATAAATVMRAGREVGTDDDGQIVEFFRRVLEASWEAELPTELPAGPAVHRALDRAKEEWRQERALRLGSGGEGGAVEEDGWGEKDGAG